MTPQGEGWWRRVRAFVARPLVLSTLAALAAAFVAYTLLGFFLVPRLVASYVPRYVEQLGRRAEIGEVRFNPLLMKVDIKNFRLKEADGRPLLGFDRLFVDLEVLGSIVRAAWTFAEIRLEAPRVDAVISADGRMNIADFLDAVPKGEPAKKPTSSPRFLLQHAVLRDGVISLTDHSGRAPQTAVVQPINIELHDITTLRERRGPYTIAATLTGGGVVGWDGYVSLVPLASAGRIDVRGFPLATAWRFVQDDLAIAEPKGELGANVRYQFAYRDGVTSLSVDGMKIAVRGVALAERETNAPLLALDEIDIVGVKGDVIARELTVPEISAKRGRVAATLARDGSVNWQRLVTTSPSPAPPVAPPPKAPVAPPTTAAKPAQTRPWDVTVEKVRVDDLALAFVDESRAAPLALDVGGVSLGLSARLVSGPSGVAGVADNIGLALGRIAVRSGSKNPLIALERIAVDGGRVDLGARRVAVSRVAINGGASTVVRDASGEISLAAALRPAEPPKAVRAAASRPPAAAANAAPPEKPWSVALDKLELADHRVAITDRGVTPAVELGIVELKASAREVRLDGKKPWPFDASFRVVQGGRFTASGSVAPDGRAVDATLTLIRLAMTPAQPYVARSAAVVLRSGEVSTAGRLTYRAGADGPSVTYTGSADIDSLAVMEAAITDPVLAWKSLRAETIRFGLGPDRLEIDEVRVTDLDGRLMIFQDKTINVAQLMKPAPTRTAATPAVSALPTTAAGADPSPAFPVAVQRVRLDNGSMNFADLSLVLPFATRIHALNGVIVGLGSDANSRASVKLDGRVDEFGSVKVDGALSALQPKVFTDLGVMFRNVPMSTLSPYSATFAGRRIVSGNLDLDLEYKIDHSELLGENKVVVRRLKLGERVDSPGAMRLPLDLAIAILSDAEGRIDIALPVRGNVDNPQFSYGHLIWQALVTVITKVATAPFRALGALFGGGGEKLETIAFEPGSDVVPPPEREKLKRVGEVLGKRPALKVTVHGGYDAKLDGEALRAFRVRQQVAQRLDVKLRPEEDPGPVAFDDVKTQRALEALLSERGGDKAVADVVARYEKSTGKKADRANRVLALVGRGGGDRALYEAIYRQLVETTPLAESELTALAHRRGEAAVHALNESAGAVAGRAAVGETELAGGAERKGIPTRLELGAVGS